LSHLCVSPILRLKSLVSALGQDSIIILYWPMEEW
jgi:hypothetical protein